MSHDCLLKKEHLGLPSILTWFAKMFSKMWKVETVCTQNLSLEKFLKNASFSFFVLKKFYQKKSVGKGKLFEINKDHVKLLSY